MLGSRRADCICSGTNELHGVLNACCRSNKGCVSPPSPPEIGSLLLLPKLKENRVIARFWCGILHSKKPLLARFAQNGAKYAVPSSKAVQGTQRLTRTSRALLHKKNRDRYTGKSVSWPVSVLSAACTRAKPARESQLSILTQDCGALASIKHAAVHMSFGELQCVAGCHALASASVLHQCACQECGSRGRRAGHAMSSQSSQSVLRAPNRPCKQSSSAKQKVSYKYIYQRSGCGRTADGYASGLYAPGTAHRQPSSLPRLSGPPVPRAASQHC